MSPFIVVPGPWSAADLRYQAEHFVTQKMMNVGFNYIATQVLVMAGGWNLADRFVEQIHTVIEQQPARASYYPGSQERRVRITKHLSAITVGLSAVGHIRDLDPGQDHTAFKEEFFAAAFASTRLPLSDPGDFLDAAVDFSNERLEGSLGRSSLPTPERLPHSVPDLRSRSHG